MPEDLQPATAAPKGLIDPAVARRTFRLERYLPRDTALKAHIEHHWLVEWDLRGKPAYTQRTLPYPCVNLVFDTGRTAIFGVMRGAFEYTLQNAGCVLGVRFRPGAFRSWLRRPVHTITDCTLEWSEVFECDVAEAERQVLCAGDDAAMVDAAEALLRSRQTAADPQVDVIQRILEAAEDERSLTRADELAERAGMSLRGLQHLFSEYVGVSPKWVIRRYRLHDAAHRLACDEAPDFAELAQELGFFDQAHFTRDFQKLVGKPPAEYRRNTTKD